MKINELLFEQLKNEIVKNSKHMNFIDFMNKYNVESVHGIFNKNSSLPPHDYIDLKYLVPTEDDSWNDWLKNSSEFSKRNLKYLTKTIQEKGHLDPILVNGLNKNNGIEVINGHHRYITYKTMEKEKIPVYYDAFTLASLWFFKNNINVTVKDIDNYIEKWEKGLEKHTNKTTWSVKGITNLDKPHNLSQKYFKIIGGNDFHEITGNTWRDLWGDIDNAVNRHYFIENLNIRNDNDFSYIEVLLGT